MSKAGYLDEYPNIRRSLGIAAIAGGVRMAGLDSAVGSTVAGLTSSVLPYNVADSVVFGIVVGAIGYLYLFAMDEWLSS